MVNIAAKIKNKQTKDRPFKTYVYASKSPSITMTLTISLHRCNHGMSVPYHSGSGDRFWISYAQQLQDSTYIKKINLWLSLYLSRTRIHVHQSFQTSAIYNTNTNVKVSIICELVGIQGPCINKGIIEQTCLETNVNGIKTGLEDMYRFVVQGHRAPCVHRLRVAWPLGAVLNLLNNLDHHSNKDWHSISSRRREPERRVCI